MHSDITLKRTFFAFSSTIIYLASGYGAAVAINGKSYEYTFMFFMFQFTILFLNNRYVPGYKESIVNTLKMLYEDLDIQKSEEIRCSVLLPTLVRKNLKVEYRYSFQGYGGPTNTKFKISNDAGQGFAGALYCGSIDGDMVLKVELPVRDDGDKFFEYWRQCGISNKDALNFKKNMRSIYCWKLKDAENNIIGILCIDGCRPRALEPENLEKVKLKYLRFLSDLLVNGRFILKVS